MTDEDKNKKVNTVKAEPASNSIDCEIDAMKSRYKTKEEEHSDLEAQDNKGMTGYMLGVNLMVSIGAATIAGYYIDQFFSTKGIFLILFIFLGFAAGVWQIWKGINKED
ncbi:MAG: F0F1-type ATP synthase assembly protein I [Alphaproteobacteria bacterium]|jgi:F0F1-type ATP synthase assembly protein I